MARIVWAPQALDDFEALLTYIGHSSPVAARRFGQSVIARVGLLASHPLLGSSVPEDDSHSYREFHQGNYRVIYRYGEDTVYIVAVHHAARLLDASDLPWTFPSVRAGKAPGSITTTVAIGVLC